MFQHLFLEFENKSHLLLLCRNKQKKNNWYTLFGHFKIVLKNEQYRITKVIDVETSEFIQRIFDLPYGSKCVQIGCSKAVCITKTSFSIKMDL